MIARIITHIILLLTLALPISGIAAPVSVQLAPGLNLVGVTAELVTAQSTAFPLLTMWKASGVTVLEAYNAATGMMQRAELDSGGNPSGSDFTLVENSAIYVYSTQLNTLSLGTSNSCAPLNLSTGFNLSSYACFSADYQAFQFITSVGLANITSLSRLDYISGRWQTAAVDNGTLAGEDFSLTAGEGYIIQSLAVSGWTAPLDPVFGLTPAALTVQQGQPGATLTATLSGVAPVGGTLINLVSSDPSLVSVPGQVTVLQGDNSVSVPLTVPDTGSVSTQTVTVTASLAGMPDVQASLSVHPKPTVDLSPLNTLTGLTFTYLLTVNLSDVAPPGGFPVELTVYPSTIVSVPSTVTIPAGTSSTQVDVTATAVGDAIITATSPGRGLSGAQNSVSVKPIQTVNYGPLISSELGIQVGPVSSGAANVDVNYGPVISGEVGVVVGSVMTGMSPNHGAIGSASLSITITGQGLDLVTGVTFQPSTGLIVGTPAVAPDGSSLTVQVDIAADAAISDRTVVLSTASGTITPSGAGVDVFKVTNVLPQIMSLIPTSGITGTTFVVQLNGREFFDASIVAFNPPDGISVGNPPGISPDGSLASVSVSIDQASPVTQRTVTITTPAGTSSTVMDVSNSFLVKPPATASTFYTQFTPLVSGEVGVFVESVPASTDMNVSYGPALSLPVGVSVGSAITAVDPFSAPISTTALRVRVHGSGLSSATAISFYPPDGITIQPNSFAIGGDGSREVTIDIAADAPLTTRTVLVALPSGYAQPTDIGSNQFRVTLPQPEIYSVQPIRAMVGQQVAMTIFGKNFSSATSVDFNPSSGISVSNPPSVNADGSMITTNFTIAADAPLGDRVVTVTTPGGVTSTVPTTVNTFSVTADMGTTYTPLLSPSVGVLVTSATGSNLVDINYGPVSSVEVGVMVTPETPPASQDVNYGPVVSRQVGIAVGGHFSGFSPFAMEPGISTVFTLTGTGLDAVTAISVIPPTNLTVTSWTPAADGLSGTVSIQADSAATAGKRTLVPMIGTTALSPVAAGIDILRIGYRPGVSSITTSFPNSSVTATVGTSITLTLNGVHLQEVTRVEIIPSDGITVDSLPTWFSDGTGEHVSVRIVVDATAAASDRLVKLTTAFGSSSETPGITNTLSIFMPIAQVIPSDAGNIWIVENKSSGAEGSKSLTGALTVQECAFAGRKLEKLLPQTQRHITASLTTDVLYSFSKTRVNDFVVLMDASRGPPVIIGRVYELHFKEEA